MIYAFAMLVRNGLFDLGILSSYKSELKVISVGNLRAGGTGKTPIVIYLSELFGNDYNISCLSRGYGRKSNGLIRLTDSSLAMNVGDEPLMLKKNLSGIEVVVSESRVEGAKYISDKINSQLIVLDDGYQHRYLYRDVNILATEFDRLFIDDHCFPMGFLREHSSAASRADVIVVTKCPNELKSSEADLLKKRFKAKQNQHIFFSYMHYETPLVIFGCEDLKVKDSVYGLAGLADNSRFFNVVKSQYNLMGEFSFGDHYKYGYEETNNIISSMDVGAKVICTEKDVVKLVEYQALFAEKEICLYSLPMRMKLLFQEDKVFYDHINNLLV
jgi:tetraacyldisaccharide 4'-kinase